MKEKLSLLPSIIIIVVFLIFLGYYLVSCGISAYENAFCDKIHDMETCDFNFSDEKIRPEIYSMHQDGNSFDIDVDISSIPNDVTYVICKMYIDSYSYSDSFEIDPSEKYESDLYFHFVDEKIPATPDSIGFEFLLYGDDDKIVSIHADNIDWYTSIKK